MTDQGPYSSYNYPRDAAASYNYGYVEHPMVASLRTLTDEVALLRHQCEERDSYLRSLHSSVAEDYLCQLVAYIWNKINTSGKPPELWTKEIMQLMAQPSKRMEAKVLGFLKMVPSIENAIKIITTAPESGWAADYRPFAEQIIKYQAPIRDLCEAEDEEIITYAPPPKEIPQPRSVAMTRGGRGRGN